jgi:serine/threonine protein kinase
MKQTPQIPGYRIIKKIGQGGMADVYLGVQEALDRQVAIKVLDPLLLRDEQFAARFIKEARTAARLDHRNIITIHDVGMTQEGDIHYYYIVMEHLAGSLNARLKKQGPLSPPQALEIIKDIARALEYAHQQGFIHRDIKPDNIMFRFDGSVVLGDFGIARAMDATTQLTRTGMSIGTPHYMSPEQCRGEKIDGRSDIYSLGVQLYEMLTGDVPYKAENTAGIIIKHIQEPIPRLPSHLGRFQPLIDSMMAKDRERRIKSGAELIDYIDTLLAAQEFSPTIPMPTTQPEVPVDDQPTIATPRPSPYKKNAAAKNKWLVPGILAAAVIITAALVIYLAISARTPAPPITPSGDTPPVEQKQKQPQISPPPDSLKTLQADTLQEDKQEAAQPLQAKEEKEAKPQKPKLTPKPAAAPTAKTVSLLELPLETRVAYAQRMKRLQVLVGKGQFRVHGQLAVNLMVDENGRTSVLSLEELLTVNPPRAKNKALTIIRGKLNNLRLTPPRDKNGKPVRFQWRLTYKVGKLKDRVFLIKQ